MNHALPRKCFMVELNFEVCKIQGINVSEPIRLLFMIIHSPKQHRVVENVFIQENKKTTTGQPVYLEEICKINVI